MDFDASTENQSEAPFFFAIIKGERRSIFFITRKYLLRGYCLAPPGRRQRITLKREILGWAELQITDGQTDVEIEIVF